MNGPSEAAHLLRMARKHLRAAHALVAPAVADVETFGFRAQQAVEKALKAWLDILRPALSPRPRKEPLLGIGIASRHHPTGVMEKVLSRRVAREPAPALDPPPKHATGVS